jgi:HD-GYP domain-containing protein (c-di-GMP phosphodiesterase class II)
MAQAQHQYEMRLKMEMGNQLRVFAMKMFRQVNKRQKKKLETKARQYLDQCSKDQKKLQNSKGAQSELDLDFEFSADPTKYLDEIKISVKKNKGLNENFKRFLHVEFEDNE